MAKRAVVSKNTSTSWEELEDVLASGKPRGKTRATVQTEIETQFDENERRDLQRLAQRAKLVRSRSPALGNVVFLHGITGSNRGRRQGRQDHLDQHQAHPDRRIEREARSQQGRSEPQLTVEATGV
jgi:hypothetical protein